MLDQFRQEVYQSFEARPDRGLNLIDGLSRALTVESPVALSESKPTPYGSSPRDPFSSWPTAR